MIQHIFKTNSRAVAVKAALLSLSVILLTSTTAYVNPTPPTPAPYGVNEVKDGGAELPHEIADGASNFVLSKDAITKFNNILKTYKWGSKHSFIHIAALCSARNDKEWELMRKAAAKIGYEKMPELDARSSYAEAVVEKKISGYSSPYKISFRFHYHESNDTEILGAYIVVAPPYVKGKTEKLYIGALNTKISTIESVLKKYYKENKLP